MLITNNLRKKALFLSYFTIAYNVVECVLALVAGSLAGSIALVGFGLDSLVESLSGGVMIYRFARHASLSAAAEERLERRAVKIVGYTFFILAAYVLYESVEKLIFQEPPAPSLLGLGIALASILVMPGLFALKYRTGKSWAAPASWPIPSRPWPAPCYPWPCSSAWGSIIGSASGRPTPSSAW